VYAVARDGVLPLSGWIGRVTPDGQPRNAVLVIYIFSAILLCTILPSVVAFTSLISAGGVPTIAAYGLIALLRLTMTPGRFRSSKWYLGKWGPPLYAIAVLFQGLVFAVSFSVFHCQRHTDVHSLCRLLGRHITVFLPSHSSDL